MENRMSFQKENVETPEWALSQSSWFWVYSTIDLAHPPPEKTVSEPEKLQAGQWKGPLRECELEVMKDDNMVEAAKSALKCHRTPGAQQSVGENVVR